MQSVFARRGSGAHVTILARTDGGGCMRLAPGPLSLTVAGTLTTGMFLGCKPTVAPVRVPVTRREAPSLAPKPEPLTPASAASAFAGAQVTVEPPAAKGAIDDKRPTQAGSAVPAGIPPKVDAGVDAIVSLPPVPDAGVMRDEGVALQ